MSQSKYDSTADTLLHIKRVSQLLNEAATELIRRGNVHDQSKLEDPEKSEFDRLTPLLKDLVYDSPEYKDSLKELGVALSHHYANNSHHPQFYSQGINGMDLFDIFEMLLDWKAATERTKDGDIYKSIKVNHERFKMSEQLVVIFENTARKLGWPVPPITKVTIADNVPDEFWYSQCKGQTFNVRMMDSYRMRDMEGFNHLEPKDCWLVSDGDCEGNGIFKEHCL